MYVLENVPLPGYSTMRLGGTARYLIEVQSRNDIQEAVALAESQQLPLLMIGGGSNIFWQDAGFPGIVLVNKISRYEIMEEDPEHIYLTVGGGNNWDSVVDWSVNEGLSGIENLSLIPGTAGATPVQNVGAYGQEIAKVLTTLEVYDLHTRNFTIMRGSECEFGYRTSRFKTTDRSRFFITAITMQLARTTPKPPFYSTLQRYLDTRGITSFTPRIIRDAVIAIRTAKLPDVALVANNGSFFRNPVVPSSEITQLIADYPEMPYWQVDNNHIKLSAAWLLDHTGFKDYHDTETGMATWPKQTLVLINENARSTADLLQFKQKITQAVTEKFSITLEQEPELLP